MGNYIILMAELDDRYTCVSFFKSLLCGLIEIDENYE